MKINELYNVKEDIYDITTNDIENVLFGDAKKADEKDTKIEKQIFHIINDYLANMPGPDEKTNAIYVLRQLYKLRNKYPEDIIPKAEKAYRGTIINKNFMKKLLKKVKNPPVFLPHDRGARHYAIPYLYTSKSEIQSWTTDPGIANYFAHESERDQINAQDGVTPIPVIIECDVDETFMLTAALTNIISEYEENEIIRISKKPIQSILYLNREYTRA